RARRRLPRDPAQRAPPRALARAPPLPAVARRAGRARRAPGMVLGAPRRAARGGRTARRVRRDAGRRPAAPAARRLPALEPRVAAGVPRGRVRRRGSRAHPARRAARARRARGRVTERRAQAPDAVAGAAPGGLRARLAAAPLVLYLAAFLAYPALVAVRLAFTDATGGAFPSLASFRVLVSDELFWRAVAGNLVVPAATVALEVVAGLALALALAWRFPGRRLVRAAVVVPFALP